MTLEPATRLGPYEIVSMIGAGGMGEVYEARDTRLQRTVALKVLTLKPGQGEGAARLERFRREAQAVSRLSHPHICSLYDVGEQDGRAFLVMERVEGETLAARLEQGPLPLERALRHGIEIASALDAAHRQGIVHRDLKPANVMLTAHGVKLLDFGLARLQPDAEDVLAATRTADLTGTGTVLGTVPYMAPEHLDGKEADARADIFALGVVLYEMVSGHRPFEGDSKGRLIAAILEHEPPPLSRLQPLAPPVLDHVLKRCLAKHPDERWQSARDVAIALGWVVEGGSDAGMALPVARRRGRQGRRRTAAMAGAMGVVGGALAAGGLLLPRAPPAAPPPLRLALHLDPPPLLERAQRSLALSPDGSRLAYVSGTLEDNWLAMRVLERERSARVSQASGATNPFFSADGRWLAFLANGHLMRTAVDGGQPVTLCEAGGLGGSWGPDDVIAFSGGPGRGLMRISARGGRPEPLTSLDTAKGDSEHAYPHFLPGGRALLHTVVRPGPTYTTVVRSLDGAPPRDLLEGFDARYLPSGHLIYVRRRSLFAIRFDLRRLAIRGEEIALQEVDSYNYYPVAHSDFSPGGTLVLAQAPARGRVVWVDRHGQTEAAGAGVGRYESMSLSRNGELGMLSTRVDVWALDVARHSETRLFGPVEGATAAISPDGRTVAYACPARPPLYGACLRAADGSGDVTVLFEERRYVRVGGWTPDGRVLLLILGAAKSGTDVWTVDVGGDRQRRGLLTSPSDEQSPSVSPDGRWLAYSSDESGEREVYVQPFSGPGRKFRISSGGGDEPVWSPAGGELFYRGLAEMMAVPVRTGPSFQAGPAHPLFPLARFLARAQRPDTLYAVAPDGQRFLMVERAEGEDAPPLILVANWLENLKRRLP